MSNWNVLLYTLRLFTLERQSPLRVVRVGSPKSHLKLSNDCSFNRLCFRANLITTKQQTIYERRKATCYTKNANFEGHFTMWH